MRNILIGLLCITLFGCSNKGDSHQESANQTASSAAAEPQNSDAKVDKKPASAWEYNEKVDEMRKETTYRATLESENGISQPFPYEGDTRLTIMLRKSADGAKDFLLVANKGQMPCFGMDGCSFRIKFDEGQIQRIAAVGSSSGQNNAIFVRSPATQKKLMESLRKAQSVIIEVDMFNVGSKQFKFSPAGLEWKWF